MARWQIFDLFVDKSLQWSHLPSWNRAFLGYFGERNPITGPFLRNYCDIASYARVLNILERLISENFLLWSRVPHVYVTHLCTFENQVLCIKLWCTHVNLNGFAVSTQVCNHNSVNCILSNHFRCYVWPPLLAYIVNLIIASAQIARRGGLIIE